VSVALGVVVSFAIRMLVATSAFWLLDQSGMLAPRRFVSLFFSGLAVPLVLFREPFRSVVLALPWAAYMQVPIDIWLGQRHGTGVLTGLAFQAACGAVWLRCCAALLSFADRKVVVLGA